MDKNTVPHGASFSVNAAPSWESLLGLYIEKASQGNMDAKSELIKMAKAADAYRKLTNQL